MYKLIVSVLLVLFSSTLCSADGFMGYMSGTVGTDYTQDADCVGAWFFNNATTLTDQSGLSNNLAVTNGSLTSTVPSGYSGNSLLFSYGYALIADASISGSFPGKADVDATACTIAGWFRFSAIGTTVSMCYKFGLSGDRAWQMYKNSSDFIYARFYNQSAAEYSFTDNNALSLDTWYHIAIVVDCTANKIYLYIDGVLEHEETFTATSMDRSTEEFRIGNTSNTMRGNIDDFIVLKRALNSTEIQELIDFGIDGSKGGND